MTTPHSAKYRFVEPASIREAKERQKALLLDLRNIEKQLGDHVRMNRDGEPLSPKEYVQWRSRTRASYVYKQNEYAELKDWIRERRRQLEAAQVKITDPNDARQLLLGARAVLRSVLNGEEPENLGDMFNVIEQHLTHAG